MPSRENDRSWMRLPRTSDEWQEKVKAYLENTFNGRSRGGTAVCPCDRCRCMSSRTQFEIHSHLFSRGFAESFIMELQNSDDGVSDDDGTPHEGLINEDAAIDYGDEEGAPSDDRAATNELIRSLIRGTIHGEIIDQPNEQPNEHAKIFFKLLQEAEKELYPGCKEASKVSFIVELFQAKCMYGISNSALDVILKLFSRVLPPGHCIPDSMDKVQRVIRDLGLDYVKIHACKNDCVLFWKENAKLDSCPICKESRWKTPRDGAEKGDEAGGEDTTSNKRLPCKILRYFPLIPRLQRLYMSEMTSSEMRWHKENKSSDGRVRHPTDSKAWKHVDDTYDWFASEERNIRLGLASDGFNPFGMQNVTYTTWPVILIPYNLPPWLCQKQPYWILSLLIPGPKSPGMNIDVYLRPLIDELKELWEKGVETWDEKVKKNFNLHAMVLWTINDFPAYAMLSGWSTKGKFACPYCHKNTDYLWLKYGSKHCYMGHRRFLPFGHPWRTNRISFNNQVETRDAPVPLTGEQVLEQYESFDQVRFGKTTSKKRKRDEDQRLHNWRKKSIFFELPYWSSLLIRHNLDVMHIEKNICESILATLLEIIGKSKDSEKARLDMQQLGIRQDQHPVIENDKYTLPAALYSLEKNDKKTLCQFLHGVKMPDGVASNIRRCVDVNSCKVSGFKTHDYHVILQTLLPLVIRKILPEGVVVALIQLSNFFNELCSKELVEEHIDRLSISIRETLCRLEMIFPPAFFDIMMHLPVHLADEAKLGGPVCYRWMYPVERYLRTVKGYVRNKAHPEGSIAEGYIVEECLTFCSRFLDLDSKLNRVDRHESIVMNEPPSGLSIFSELDYKKRGQNVEDIKEDALRKMRYYIISNCDEARPWIDEHKEELRKYGSRNINKRHQEQFVRWFEAKITKLHQKGEASDMMYSLAKGPDHRARVINRCHINNWLFRTAAIERSLTTQNSGVLVKGDATTGNMSWYGVINKMFSLEFPGQKEIVLFQCVWYDVPAVTTSRSRGYNRDKFGIIDIDTTRFRYSNEPYIMATQAEPVFYVKLVNKPGWSSVVVMKPRNLYAMPEAEDEVLIDVDSIDPGIQDINLFGGQEDMSNWTRSGMEGITGDATVIQQVHATTVDEPDDAAFIDDDDDEEDDTYINDGVVAPLDSVVQSQDDDFFV